MQIKQQHLPFDYEEEGPASYWTVAHTHVMPVLGK